jgi:hypothetical protein
VTIPFERRILASWKEGGWALDGGVYQLAVGHDALDLGAPAAVALPGARWK